MEKLTNEQIINIIANHGRNQHLTKFENAVRDGYDLEMTDLGDSFTVEIVGKNADPLTP